MHNPQFYVSGKGHAKMCGGVYAFLYNHHMCFQQITLADLRAYDIISNLRGRIPEAVAKAPLLCALCDRVAAEPKIKAWLEKRPVTDI